MRRKRLNHCSDIVCDMFCGWRLMNSYEDLVRLGSGHLVINLILPLFYRTQPIAYFPPI